MIGIIAASIFEHGHSARVGEIYLEEFQKKGAECVLLKLSSLPPAIAFENVLKKERSPGFQPIQQQVNAIDKFVFAVPEYNGSFPGILKVFLDACEYPHSFSGKKAGLVGFSGGMFGNIRGLDHLDAILSYMQVATHPNRVHIPRIDGFLNPKEGDFDPKIMQQIRTQVELFLEY